MFPANFYTETGLDQMSERRADEDWIAGLVGAPEELAARAYAPAPDFLERQEQTDSRSQVPGDREFRNKI